MDDLRPCYHGTAVFKQNSMPMRYIGWIADWITDWIPATLTLTVVNVSLFAFLLYRDGRLRKGLYTLELHTGPNTFSDHALALHLGLLQATVVGIGVGITVAGLIGYKSMREEAVEKAVEKAEQTTKAYLDALGINKRDEAAETSADTPIQASPLDPEQVDPEQEE